MKSVNALISMLDESQRLSEPFFSMWVEALFALGKYDEVISLGQKESLIENTMQIPLKGVSVAYAYTVSLLKRAHFDEALAFTNKVKPILESTITEVPLPLRLAINAFLSLIPKIELRQGDTLYWQYFDPLSYDKF